LEEIADLEGRPRAVAIGVFDGVHHGHRRIVAKAVAAAREMDGVATVLTFDPHPDAVLHPGEAPRTLTPLALKVFLLAQLGVEEVAVVQFTPEFAGRSAEDFCRGLLSRRLGARQVVVGANFRFGKNASGRPADLLAFGQEHDFSVTAIGLLEMDGAPISSTRIRDLLAEGRVEQAAELLGRPHSLQGPVVPGAGRGKGLGVPTANLQVEPRFVVPAEGVYVTRTVVDQGPVVPSVTSVGTNPTFESDGLLRIETFLLDYEDSLYGRYVSVEFLAWIRGQLVFAEPGPLVARIQDDIRTAQDHFRLHGVGQAASLPTADGW